MIHLSLAAKMKNHSVSDIHIVISVGNESCGNNSLNIYFACPSIIIFTSRAGSKGVGPRPRQGGEREEGGGAETHGGRGGRRRQGGLAEGTLAQRMVGQ
jgi:hypothetical protein